MKKRVRMCEVFLAMVNHSYMLMKDNMITIDKSAVLFQTHETKEESKQRLPKGRHGPIKAKVLATRIKQMV